MKPRSTVIGINVFYGLPIKMLQNDNRWGASSRIVAETDGAANMARFIIYTLQVLVTQILCCQSGPCRILGQLAPFQNRYMGRLKIIHKNKLQDLELSPKCAFLV